MNKEKLKEVLSIQSESFKQWRMFAYIIRQLKAMGCNYYVYNGCIYTTKGKADNYPCIVSHMDTVHDITSDLTPIEVNGRITGINKYTMRQEGIGGDDKVGVFIALECLKHFDNIKAVFFKDEEVGCNGSYDPDDKFFVDCRYILQCDRKGYGDFVTVASGTVLSLNDFQDAVKPIIKKYKYKFCSGMMTDVMALKQSGIKCAMANLSCGYYNPHSHDEYVSINEVNLCLNMVIEIFSKVTRTYTCKNKPYKTPVPYTSVKKYKKDRDFVDNYDSFYSHKKVRSEKWDADMNGICECCREQSDKLKYDSSYNIEMCPKCIKEYSEPLKYNINGK